MIKARPVWRSFVYSVNLRASHLGMSQKRDRTAGRTRRFFLAMGGVSDLPALTYTLYFTCVVVGMRGASEIGLIGPRNVCSGIINP